MPPNVPALPCLSLVCCTVDRADKIIRLLDSLCQQTRADFELIIVDQNPPGMLYPILAPFADRLSIVHVRSERGLSRARNVGIAACRSALISFPDDDCWYPQDLIAKLTGLFDAQPGLGLITGRTLDAQGVESLGLFMAQDAPIARSNIWLAGNSNAIFIRADIARAIGGFDETLGVGAATAFRSGEETDFVLRALASGARGAFKHDLIVHHDQVPIDNSPRAIARAHDYALGFGRVLRLHDFGALYAAMRVVRSSGRAVLSALQGDGSTARYKARWALGTFKGYCAPLERPIASRRAIAAAPPPAEIQ